MQVNLQKLLAIVLVMTMVCSVTIIETKAKAKKKDWIKLTKTEYTYLCRVVETETYGGTTEGKRNVASVVINRYKSKKFNGSITSIITSPDQFAYGNTKISKKTKKAVKYVAKHGDTAKGALFFHSGRKTQQFAGASYVFTDNVGHHFYK